MPSFGAGQSPCPTWGFQGGFGPLWADLARCSTAVEEAYPGNLPPHNWFTEDERKSRIKAGVADGSFGQSHLPAVRAVTGVLRCIKSGVKNRRRGLRLRSLSPNTYCHNEKIGVMPRKGAVYERKRKVSLLPVTREEGHPGAPVSGGRKPEYDRLRRAGGGLLPGLPQRHGRLGQLEDRLSSIAFRQAVEQDMVAGILADVYQFSDEDLRRRRAESVQNVKKTNGRVSLEQRVRGAWEEDDEWQD